MSPGFWHGVFLTAVALASILAVIGVFYLVVHLVWEALCGERWARLALVAVILAALVVGGGLVGMAVEMPCFSAWSCR